MALPRLTDSEIIDQLDFEDAGFDYEWVGNTITYKFPTTALETTSYDFDADPIVGPGPEALAFEAVDAGTKALFRIAIQAWDDLIAPDMVEKMTPGEADIEVAFTTQGVFFAHAYYPEEDPDIPTSSGGTVWLNSDFDGSEVPANDLIAAPIGSYGFNTYLHELGHAMGLDHMGEYTPSDEGPFSFQDTTVYSVMSYWGPAGPNPQEDAAGQIEQADWEVGNETYDAQTPMLSDVLAIQAMYGVSTTTRTGNTTYGFNAAGLGSMDAIFDFTKNPYPVVCIFDSAGNDTLDLSGFTGHNIITLVPGALSSVSNSGFSNSMSNNLSIAHSAVIENAVGGSGNDSISGSTGANALEGGAGNDTILGGAGNDTLTGGAGNDSLNGQEGAGDVAIFSGTFLSYTITFNAGNSAWTLSSPGTGTDVASNIESFQFADVTKTPAELIGTDTTAPVLSGTTPPDNATGVDVNGNIALSFSEAVRAGSGAITIHESGGAVVHTMSATDTSQVSFTGSTLLLNPSVSLAYNTAYYINIAAGAVEDLAGNDFAGISNAGTLNFTTDTDDFSSDVGTSGIVTVGGAALAGGINFNNDEDFFRVSLGAGQTYVFDLRAANGPAGLDDPQLVLYNLLAQSLASDDDSGGGDDARIVFTSPTSGTYFLGANDAGTGTGAYTVSAVSAAIIPGGPDHDTLAGSSALELIRGQSGNDTLRGNGGDDILEGGAGLDTAEYSGMREHYEVLAGSAVTVKANSGSDGTDRATGVERLHFADEALALDLDGNAGTVARTLGAVFGEQALDNRAYVKIGLDLVDGGMDATALMDLALRVALGPNATHAQVVTRLYTNVVGSEPGAGDLAAFVSLLDAGTFTPASLGVFAAQTAYNDENIGMAGLAQSGIAFDL